MKYKVKVGSFVTRFNQKSVTVFAKNEEEAREKAIDKYIDKEMELPCYSDFGTPQVDYIKIIE